MWWPLLACLVTSLIVTPGHGELYTALVDMEQLLETEAVLIKTLETYIDAQERKLRQLKSSMYAYAKEHQEASEDVQRYLMNPINAYLLVKRLTTDWKMIESQMTHDNGMNLIDNITNIRADLKFPSEEDLNGAAVALMRLQDTYKLDTHSVAQGELNGVQYSKQMTAGDCFELGRQSYNNGDHYHTVLWMNEALRRQEGEMNKTVERADILEYLAFSTYMQGNVHTALQLTNELLELVPGHPRACGNKIYYLEDLEKSKNQRKGDSGEEESEDTAGEAASDIAVDDPLPERAIYEMLCRGETQVPADIQAQLKCRYTDLGNPYLKLARVKEEEAYLWPRIVLYHEVMSDAEIRTIKRLAQPRFRRATVQNYKTGELETANYRISKSAWLREDEHKHIASVNRRVEDLTRLTTSTAEELQVVNYGIGGHYEPHFDFARRDEPNAFRSLGTGNRIATLLFYMTDVAQGGATVFPSLRLALWPRKGSAAFWHNLRPSGEGDYLTRHAACPVLAGSKWVANKWLHERGQEWLRPCDLDPEAP